MSNLFTRAKIVCGAVLGASLTMAVADDLTAFDFTQPNGLDGWGGIHDISNLTLTGEGLKIAINGGDPYLSGPPRNYPVAQRLWMVLRAKVDLSGPAQIFYWQTGNPSEENSVVFFVNGGDWQEIRVPLPELNINTRLRLDPPGNARQFTISSIRFERRPTLVEPQWPSPSRAVNEAKARLTSGPLTLIHDSKSLGAFEVRVNDRCVAVGHDRNLIGYLHGGSVHWLNVTNSVSFKETGGQLAVSTTFADPDGARWNWVQTFSPKSNVFEVTSQVSVDQDRSVVYLPMITLLPGVGTYGTNKTQGVFAGVEYLENEASSSDLDMLARLAKRQVPSSEKITFPLMAMSSESNYVGLIWEQKTEFAALHDSPDRLFHSGGHLMSVLFPGAEPVVREDGSVLPYDGTLIRAGQTVTLKATLIGGVGSTIVPALQQYVALRGMPKLPESGYSAQEYYKLAAHGWMDTPLRDGARYRHAVGETFGSAPAADAALLMDWLANKTEDAALAARLQTASREALAAVQPQYYDVSGVGHVRHPMESLVYGHVLENVATAATQGRGILKQFGPDGSIQYHAPEKGNDLASTHWSREANGLTSITVLGVLERALFSGDKALMNEGLQKLRALNKFRNSVPRGAQTWEVPLHTPDILASAYMLEVNLIGYEVTGEADFLEQARYWAWTGVPFVYLVNPVKAPVGIYSTIAVFGATQFVSPVWIGLPVQWCGMVYADAIRRFAKYDPAGPWRQLAEGITVAGLQHTHPLSDPDRAGLLPDSYELRHQFRNPVPINPATLMTSAIEHYGEPMLYDYAVMRRHGLVIHAPGPIQDCVETEAGIRFNVTSWPKTPWNILITGCVTTPELKINGQLIPIQAPHQYDAKTGCLVLQLTGSSKIELSLNRK